MVTDIIMCKKTKGRGGDKCIWGMVAQRRKKSSKELKRLINNKDQINLPKNKKQKKGTSKGIYEANATMGHEEEENTKAINDK